MTHLDPFLVAAHAPRTAKAALITDQDSYWKAIVNHLNDLLKILQENCVPTIFSRKIFTQIFAFINAQLFNSLLVRRECCSFSNGEYVKQGLEELEAWCTQSKPEVIFKKFRVSYDEIMSNLCPVRPPPPNPTRHREAAMDHPEEE
ncbi:hypothetical protein ZWY2020_058627 [Hordeum vulgare]|nr:hypothetical protein ZWY2020_058627 [Hordeum vulgare]